MGQERDLHDDSLRHLPVSMRGEGWLTEPNQALLLRLLPVPRGTCWQTGVEGRQVCLLGFVARVVLWDMTPEKGLNTGTPSPWGARKWGQWGGETQRARAESGLHSWLQRGASGMAQTHGASTDPGRSTFFLCLPGACIYLVLVLPICGILLWAASLQWMVLTAVEVTNSGLMKPAFRCSWSRQVVQAGLKQ